MCACMCDSRTFLGEQPGQDFSKLYSLSLKDHVYIPTMEEMVIIKCL